MSGWENRRLEFNLLDRLEVEVWNEYPVLSWDYVGGARRWVIEHDSVVPHSMTDFPTEGSISCRQTSPSGQMFEMNISDLDEAETAINYRG